MSLRRVQVQRRPMPDKQPEGLHPVVSRVLAMRGLTAVPDYSLRQLARPEFGGLKRACQILTEAISGDAHILVVGDFDADGATGTALAVHGLRAMGARHVDWLVPDRFRHGYGLSPELVAEIGSPCPDVLVTVDQGVSSHAGIALAQELGMRVIVTDHHLPGETLPGAEAIINPNLPGERFPSRALAGVGVMFYLLMGLRTHLREAGHFRGRKEPRLDQWLDLVALGTVADLVPLDENNRRLVHQGLVRIRAGQCLPGVRALLEAAGRNLRHVQASDLGFAAGPRLNAAGRLDDMSIGIRCLLAESDAQGRELAAELDRLNRERRSIQQDMQEEAEIQAQRLAEGLSGDVSGLCVFEPHWHQGVVGLVAGRLMERLQRPVFAFAPAEEGGDELKGSGRGPEGIHLRDLLVDIESREPGLIKRFGGHSRAAGLSLDQKRYPEFMNHFNKILKSHDFQDESILTDGELIAEDLSLKTAEALNAAGPWGQAWPEPLFDGAFRILDRRVVGEKHLKLRLAPSGQGPALDAIAFRAGRLCHEELPNPLHVVYSLEINRWQGQVNPQLNIRYLVDTIRKFG